MEMFEKSAAHEVFRELIACQNGENEELKNNENELKIEMSESTQVKYH